MAGPEPTDLSERGADTPDEEPWSAVSAEPDDAVANEERDVATGDAAVQEVPKRMRRNDVRPDDRIREDIEDAIRERVNAFEIAVDVIRGAVVPLAPPRTPPRCGGQSPPPLADLAHLGKILALRSDSRT